MFALIFHETAKPVMLEQAYWEQSKYGMVVLLGHFAMKQTENRAYKSFVLQNSSLDQERTALISL